jgi:GDP-4-dehydro-6-deoxy-D-mannose reductase
LYGTYLKKSLPPAVSRIQLFQCDLRNQRRLQEVLRRIRPQQIYHLAAYSSAVNSFADVHLVHDTNFWGTYNLLDAARNEVPECRVLVVTSGQCYGRVGLKQLPFKESCPLSPQNPYALSKAAADMLAGQYHSRLGLHVIRARPFNHTGPRQASEFVCSDFAKQVAEIELRLRRPILHVGDLTIRRDFSDVRDVVRAYEGLIEKGEPGAAYNVASGRAISLKQIITVLTKFSSRSIRVSVQKDRIRRGEAASLYGSAQRLRRDTGWKPEIAIKTTLRDLYLFWKETLELERESISQRLIPT